MMKTQWDGGISLFTIPKGQQTLFSRRLRKSEPCWAVTGKLGLCAGAVVGPWGSAGGRLCSHRLSLETGRL